MSKCLRIFAIALLGVIAIAGQTVSAESVRILSDIEGVTANINLVNNGSIGTELNVEVPAIEVNSVLLNSTEYKEVLLPAGDHLSPAEIAEDGMPTIPIWTTMLAIPDLAGVRLSVSFSGYDIIDDFDLAPSQASSSDNNPDAVVPFEINQNFYGTDAFYPEELADAADPVIMRDVRGVQIQLHPVQYNPVRRELRVYHDLAVSVSYDGEPVNPKTTRRPYLSEGFLPLYKAMFANFDELYGNMDVQRGGYVIICKAAIADSLKALALWKHQKGYTSRIVKTIEIRPNGIPTSAQIFAFLDTAYDTWAVPPEYVMFVGDRDGTLVVPDYPYNSYPSDHHYSQVDGTDFLPDIFVARLSVDNISELRIAVSKIIKYEKAPLMSDPEHWIRGLAVGYTYYNTARFTTLWARQVALRNGFAQVDTVYGQNADPDVQRYFASGPGMIWYRGAGGSDGWWGPSMDISDLLALPNNQKLGVCTPMTCGLGDFGANECFGETWIRMGANPDSLKGGPAFFGVSDHDTHAKWNNPIMIGYFFGIFERNIYHFAAAAVAGKLQDFRTFPRNQSMVQQYFNTYNMQGDPELELRTKIPIILSVTHPATLAFGLNHIEINVADTAEHYIKDAIVTLIKRVDSTEEVYSLGKTDEGGNISLSFAAPTAGDMILTVSGQNLYPYQGIVTLVNGDIAVGFDSLAIDDNISDFSYGNGDSLANPGETLELYVTLKNFGDSLTADSVVTNLALIDEGLAEIYDGNSNYGNIAPGQTLVNDHPYVVRVSPNAQDRDLIRLKQTVTDQNNDSWYSVIEIPLRAPKFTISRVAILDENNRLDPGDTVSVLITLMNRGQADAQYVTASLGSEDDYTTIIDGGSSFGDIPVGDTASNAEDFIVLAVDSGAFAGRRVSLILHTTTASGAISAVPFSVTVDSTVARTDPTGPDNYGYYIYDTTDASYAPRPHYNWVELAPGLGGQGRRLNFGGNTDDKSVIDTLAFDFVYYGSRYRTLIVCTNGFVSPDTSRYDMGGNYWANFFNWPIPDPGNARAQISPFWDDLQVSSSGNYGVFVWNDTTDHRHVIEWSHTTNRNTNAIETFEMIIYDPAYYPTLTGDAAMLFQYSAITNNDVSENYATVGLESWDEQDGVQYTHDNYYAPGAATLTNNMALFITTSTGRGGIRGIVDLANGGYNQNVTVKTSSGQHRSTPQSGEFWLRNVPPDTLSVTAEIQGYFPQTIENVVVAANQTISGINFAPTICQIPGSVAATDSLSDRIEIRWHSVTGSNFQGYYVYRSQWENGAFARVNLNPVSETLFVDNTVPDTGAYWYYVTAIYSNNYWITESFASNKDSGSHNNFTGLSEQPQIPLDFFLSQNYPNPFNPATRINFGLPNDSDVKVEVYNLLGQRVKMLLSGREKAGYKALIWDGTNDAGSSVSSGVYFYKVEAGSYKDTKKMTLLK